jgi:hypothetical protein
MSKDQEKIVDRIKKLLRLAESSNANEAANAAGQAQRLMEQHRIDQAMIDVNDEDADDEPDEPISDEYEPLETSGRLAQWKISLATGIARVNGCRCYIGSIYKGVKRGRYQYDHTLNLIGRPSDVTTVSYLFSYLVKEIERLVKLNGKGRGRTWNNSYRLGAVSAINTRMREGKDQARKEARAKLEGDSTALVKMDQALARMDALELELEAWIEENMNLRARQGSSSRRDWGAFAQGQKDGRNIDLGGSDRKLGNGAKAIGDGD